MSIYGSTFGVGRGDDDDRGVVLIRDDGDNHYPDPATFRRGALDGALISDFCVPGHDDGGGEEVGGWYRLAGCSWRVERGFPRPQLWSDQEYLLDVDAVRALRRDLTRWLKMPKVYPEGTTP